jgi:cyclic 2,3-diphosphoglycerate synthetase
VFDGSGAAIPPVATSARILVTTPAHDLDAYLNPYRVAISDLVVGVGDVRGADVLASLRLRPMQPLGGRRTAVFTTGAAPVEHLDAELVHVSRNLANREALRAELAGIDADVYLVELKAAAIDVVAEEAAARGAELVLAANDVAGDGLDDAILELVPANVTA